MQNKGDQGIIPPMPHQNVSVPGGEENAGAA